MYYYSVLLLLTRCEEEKISTRTDGGLNRNQLCVGQPSVSGAVGPISISWTLEAVKLFSWIQIFFLCACEKTYLDRKISATTPNVWRLLLWNIQKRVFRFVFIYFFVGPLFSRRRRRVVIRARDLFCRFLRMCDVCPSNLFGSRVECNSWLAPLPKSQTGKWLASACRSIDNTKKKKKVNRITAVPFFLSSQEKRELI